MLQIGIFAAITLGLLALFWVVSDFTRPGGGRRRLAGEIGEKVGGQPPAVELYRNLSSWDADLGADGTPSAVRAARVAHAGRGERTEDFLREAGVALAPRHLIGGTVCVAGGLGLALGFFVGWVAGVAAATAVVIGVPLVLNAKRKARRDRYVVQLAGAFELMARVLRAGQSVPESFRAATEAFEDPLRSEFGRCNHQIEHGLRPEVAYRELSERAGILELRIFVVAMAIQQQTGGNLSEVLERMATTIRVRVRLRQRLRALTAEGRLQSVTLLVLPLTFAVLYFLNRQYAEALLTQWKLLVATVALMGVGVLWIRNIMKFEG